MKYKVTPGSPASINLRATLLTWTHKRISVMCFGTLLLVPFLFLVPMYTSNNGLLSYDAARAQILGGESAAAHSVIIPGGTKPSKF